MLARLRRRNWRVNLRPLADTRNLVWIPLCWVLCYWLLRALGWLAWAIASAPQALEDAADEQQRWRQHAQRQRQQWQQQQQQRQHEGDM